MKKNRPPKVRGRVLARVLADDLRIVNGGEGFKSLIWCNDVREGSGVANSNDNNTNAQADTD